MQLNREAVTSPISYTKFELLFTFCSSFCILSKLAEKKQLLLKHKQSHSIVGFLKHFHQGIASWSSLLQRRDLKERIGIIGELNASETQRRFFMNFLEPKNGLVYNGAYTDRSGEKSGAFLHGIIEAGRNLYRWQTS